MERKEKEKKRKQKSTLANHWQKEESEREMGVTKKRAGPSDITTKERKRKQWENNSFCCCCCCCCYLPSTGDADRYSSRPLDHNDCHHCCLDAAAAAVH